MFKFIIDWVKIKFFLKFPMFETTETEKEILKVALIILDHSGKSSFLCRVLNKIRREGWFSEETIDNLKDKVMASIAPQVYLERYLNFMMTPELQRILRKEWIRQLLKYKGDKS